MSKKFKFMVDMVDKFDWHYYLIGFIMLFSGLSLLYNYQASVKDFIILVGLVAILKGFLNFNIFYQTHETIPVPALKNVFFYTAIFGIIHGLIIVFSGFSSDIWMHYLIGIWCLIDVIPHLLCQLAHPIKNEKLGLSLTFLYGISILAAILLFIPTSSMPLSASILLGIYFIATSINLAVMPLKNKKEPFL